MSCSISHVERPPQVRRRAAHATLSVGKVEQDPVTVSRRPPKMSRLLAFRCYCAHGYCVSVWPGPGRLPPSRALCFLDPLGYRPTNLTSRLGHTLSALLLICASATDPADPNAVPDNDPLTLLRLVLGVSALIIGLKLQAARAGRFAAEASRTT